MKIKDRIAALKAEMAAIRPDANGDYTIAQANAIEAKAADILRLEAEAAKFAQASGLVESLAASAEVEDPTVDEEGLNGFDGLTRGAKSRRRGAAWAAKSVGHLRTTASRQGLKSMLNGEVRVPDPIVSEYTALPDTPHTLLDLIPIETQNSGSRVSYLRQVTREDNARGVAQGDLKPESIYVFTEEEARFVTIAHVSQPFPVQLASDFPKLSTIIGEEMLGGVVRAVEKQVLTGEGVDEGPYDWEATTHTTPSLRGVLHTSGTQAVSFAGDMLTTMRKAVTRMTSLGEQPTGWVLSAEDAEQLDLLRENGASGGFLLDDTVVNRLLKVPHVISHALTPGTALLADWNATQLTVREGMSTLRFDQHKDYAQRNLFMIRSEGRFAFHIARPQAVAVVDLTA